MDSSDARRGTFRNGLGTTVGTARTALFELEDIVERSKYPVIESAISLLAVAAFWAFAEWRFGLLLCLATAILQDPLRKLTPDQPVIFVVLAGVVFGAACLGALAAGRAVGSEQHIRT